MMARLAVLVPHEARMQFRYGIYAAYAFVVTFYVIILYWGDAFLPDWVPALIIFTDPAAVGFFFLGALMMLEKAETVRTALAVTPISAMDYFWAKALTLTAMALVSVTILTPLIHTGANWPMLAVVVVLTSLHFLGIGVPAALYFRTVTSYLIGAAGWLLPLIAPAFVALLDPMPAWAILIPAASQFRLMLVATGAATASPIELAAMFAVTALAAVGTIWLARWRLEKEFGRQ